MHCQPEGTSLVQGELQAINLALNDENLMSWEVKLCMHVTARSSGHIVSKMSIYIQVSLGYRALVTRCRVCKLLSVRDAWAWYCYRRRPERAAEDVWLGSWTICSKYSSTDHWHCWSADTDNCRAWRLSTWWWPRIGTELWHESCWSVFTRRCTPALIF